MNSNLPEVFLKDIEKAIKILKEIGFEELFLFGSVVSNKLCDNSDIDFAVKGIPDDKFFYALGKLDMELDHKGDLINLDKKSEFNDLILKKNEILKIA
jgi:predicted nucleotidyltransferase